MSSLAEHDFVGVRIWVLAFSFDEIMSMDFSPDRKKDSDFV